MNDPRKLLSEARKQEAYQLASELDVHPPEACWFLAGKRRREPLQSALIHECWRLNIDPPAIFAKIGDDKKRLVYLLHIETGYPIRAIRLYLQGLTFHGASFEAKIECACAKRGLVLPPIPNPQGIVPP